MSPSNIFQYIIRRDIMKDTENQQCNKKINKPENKINENNLDIDLKYQNLNIKNKNISLLDNIILFLENESFIDIINN